MFLLPLFPTGMREWDVSGVEKRWIQIFFPFFDPFLSWFFILTYWQFGNKCSSAETTTDAQLCFWTVLWLRYLQSGSLFGSLSQHLAWLNTPPVSHVTSCSVYTICSHSTQSFRALSGFFTNPLGPRFQLSLLLLYILRKRLHSFTWL